MTRFVALVLLLATLAPCYVAAQDETETPGDSEPVPYDPLEFPKWSRDLRRGEIVAVGSFPVAMIVAGLLYQVGRFSYQSYQAGGAAMEYAPWFLSTSNEPRYNDQERRGLIASGIGISVGVALADYIIGRRREVRIPD